MNDRLSQRAAMALVAMLVLCTGRSAFADGPHCPTGSGCSGDNNGRGIYISETGSYCLQLVAERELYFCPESFENESLPGLGPSQVRLRGRLWDDGTELVVYSDPLSGTYQGTVAVSVVDAGTPAGFPASRLVISFKDLLGGSTGRVLGGTLPDITLWATVRTGHGAYSFGLYFMETHVPGRNSEPALYQYHAWYRHPDGAVLRPYCQHPFSTPALRALSILPQHQVSGLTGLVEGSSSSVTLACDSGAIATCMSWGYVPWNPELVSVAPARVLGACIQGKRAAYFGRQLDFDSYTKQGANIFIQDLDIHSASAGPLEALWDEQGAACISPGNQRTQADGQKFPLPPGLELPSCANLTVSTRYPFATRLLFP